MTCARIADLDFVERYVLGQMDEAEQASFEAHYFECPDCFTAVQALQAAQGVLRESPADTASHAVTQTGAPPQLQATASRVVDFGTHAARNKSGDGAASGPTRSRLMSASWIALAAAASLAGLMVWTPWRTKTPAGTGTGVPPAPVSTSAQHTPVTPGTSGQPAIATPSGGGDTGSGGATQPSGTGPAVRPGTTPGSIRSLINPETLALVIPPPYVPLQTRGTEPASGEAFAAAMKKYAAKDYRGAVNGLKAVVEAQPDAVHAQFFLGISYLVLDEPADASAVLNRVAGSNAPPFADEAHFYLAKAALRAHDFDRAERELSLAIERQAGPPNEAQKLLQAVRLYRRDHGQD